jgi:DNA-binding protein WhiA
LSFCAQAKQELCRLSVGRHCCVRAEVYGALLFGYAFRPDEVRVVTENGALAARLKLLFGRLFGFDFDQRAGRPDVGKHTLVLSDRGKLAALFETFGYGGSPDVALHLNNAVLENDCCAAAFLRGAFLTGGSVTDPEKKYHLELGTPRAHVGRETITLLREMDFAPSLTARAGHTVLYLKASEQIEDFLTTVGASQAALALMETTVEKDLRNRINRKVNCETANLSKTVEAAMRQTEAIRRLRESPLWETLPAPLRETADMRLAHPEEPLAELCALFDPPLGRSGLNHRLRRLRELAEDR